MIFIRLDENISYKIGQLAELIRIRQGLTFEAAFPLNETGLPDRNWMVRLAGRGKPGDLRMAFSGDDFSEAERATAEINKVTIFSAPKMFWRPLGRVGQAAYLLRWLPRMIELAEEHPAGSQFQLPRTFNLAVAPRLLPSILDRKVVRPGRPRRPKAAAPTPLLD